MKRLLRRLFRRRSKLWIGMDHAGGGDYAVILAYDLKGAERQFYPVIPPIRNIIPRPGYDREEISWPFTTKSYVYGKLCTPEHRCGRCGRLNLT